jgi:dipeptidyl aminopeptidase/acylaminoacyl peptidase
MMCRVQAESGFPFPELPIQTFIPAARSEEEARKYMACSPVTYASKVKAPTLLQLGSEDLRVPMSQGMAYYRALKAHGKTAE